MTQQPVKRLYRSRSQRMLGGVLGGFGEYTNMDPTLVRVGFVLLALVTAVVPAAIAYVIALLMVPEAPMEAAPPMQAMTAPPTPPPPQ